MHSFKNKKPFIRRGQKIKKLNDGAHTLPLWIGRSMDEMPPALCGSLPANLNYFPRIGDLVAALITYDATNPLNSVNQYWILAEVIHINGSQIEIDDIDEDNLLDENGRYHLHRRFLIPLPLFRANPETNPEALFKPDKRVLALYPQTTCFYRGKVLHPPVTANGTYKILFDDGTYQDGFSPPMEVPQRFVVDVPKDNIFIDNKKRRRSWECDDQ